MNHRSKWARTWPRLEIEYIHDPSVSIRSLSVEHGIPFGSVAKVAVKRKWHEKRRAHTLRLEEDSLDAHRRHIHQIRAEYAPQIIAATVKTYLAVMERIHIDETTGIVRPDSERDSASRQLVVEMMQRLLGMHDEQIDIQRKLLAASKPGSDEAKDAVATVAIGELSQQAIQTYGLVKMTKEDPEADPVDDEEDEDEEVAEPPAEELVGSPCP